MKKTKKIIKQVAGLSSFLSLLLATKVLGQGWSPENYSDTGLPDGYISGIVSNIAFWILGIFGFVGVIGFVIAGIMYLTAAGNAEQEKTAKKAMTMSIIGIIVGLVGLVVIYAADALLRGTDAAF